MARYFFVGLGGTKGAMTPGMNAAAHAMNDMGSIEAESGPDTWVDEVIEINEDERCTWIASLPDSAAWRTETFVGFEIPLAEMWLDKRAPPCG